MFVLSVLEAPNTNTNSLCVQTHLAIKLFLILILILSSLDENYTILYYLLLVYKMKVSTTISIVLPIIVINTFTLWN